jgi:hypothetical protein
VYSDQCTAFVKSIAAGTSDDELRAVFASCGELRGLRHMRDAQGETRVCAMSWDDDPLID